MNAKCRNKTLDSPSTVRAWCNARNTYAAAIKRAKREHWNQFLEKEDPKIIFKAIKYTKNNRIRRIPNIKGKDGVQLKENAKPSKKPSTKNSLPEHRLLFTPSYRRPSLSR
ncbi:uncharacterized protein K441DRAFT_46349 [Cenococcum geophilum 1.58]|uniref:uncharacterized protein n=1 Tax=Cenococcum geophilum 1.58 TaxID=794803 RepID=UPI00358F069E|nr:hypothetical protein K441DRAFT_46349 [Cenococcum geophilum 1.58]